MIVSKDGEITLFTKGADTVMLDLIEDDSNFNQEHLDDMAREGL